MVKVRRIVLKLYIDTKCLALTFCVLCLILVLIGILYTGWFHPEDRHIHPPDSLMGRYNISGHRNHFLTLSSSASFFRSTVYTSLTSHVYTIQPALSNLALSVVTYMILVYFSLSAAISLISPRFNPRIDREYIPPVSHRPVAGRGIPLTCVVAWVRDPPHMRMYDQTALTAHSVIHKTSSSRFPWLCRKPTQRNRLFILPLVKALRDSRWALSYSHYCGHNYTIGLSPPLVYFLVYSLNLNWPQ